VTYYDAWSPNDGRGDLRLRLVDPDGATVLEQALTVAKTATTTTQFTFGFVAIDGPASYVIWTDDGRGQPEVRLKILNPDNDQDGLSNAQELFIGTNPDTRDTDGGGRTDAEEVLTDGTDPLDSEDDVPGP
jgi:hypothetical protein